MKEGSIKKKTRTHDLGEILLKTVMLAGSLADAFLAPHATAVMRRRGIRGVARQEEIIKNARLRLIRRGFLAYQSGKLRLTPKGERALRRWELKEYQIPKPRHWDGKWRVLIFDIPEYRRAMRAQVRVTLARIGFVRLQDSVWLFPYECGGFIQLLKADFKLGKDILYLTVDSLEYDAPWRTRFNLP
jgi:hypothetical protein